MTPHCSDSSDRSLVRVTIEGFIDAKMFSALQENKKLRWARLNSIG
jgi:hypothetical protein